MSYLSLEEAAAKLGISTDQLVELRSQGQVRGFRDGSSWKFPDTEIDRLAEDLVADGAGSGLLVSGSGIGSGKVIGGDWNSDADGSDVNIGAEPTGEGSDVNLVTGSKGKGKGSDVELVSTDSGKLGDELEQDSLFESNENALQEIDSAELRLNDPAILHDSADSIDIAIDPKEGSTGPVARAEIEAEVDKISISDVDVPDDASADDDFAFAGELSEEDSDDLMLGEDSDSLDLDALSDEDLQVKAAGASSLELMNELDSPDSALKSSGADVLSELDLLGAEQGGSGSGLISGDSENLLTSSGLGSGLGSSVINEMDDALDEDDDLVIADDDAELMLDSVSDISVAGDSGINLMSPSDSGLSLESEPLDLAGSSLSALDLGAELTDGSGISGSSGKNAGGSDEEFQLSPSGVGLDGDFESSSQVIEVEDSEIVADAVDFQDDYGDDAGFADAGFADAEALGDDAFDDAPAEAVALDADSMGGEALVMDDVDESPAVAAVGAAGYEVPFSLMQCLSLLFIVLTLSLGGMLMTDLVRNMWTYNDISSPVSALTDSLISLMGWD